jgi:hypothetical protein
VAALLAKLEAPTARVRFASFKALALLSEQAPQTLYPHFDFFAGLLNHPNRIFQWQAIRILARLAVADQQGKFERIFRRFFDPIQGPVMITAANLIGAAPWIVKAKPACAFVRRQLRNARPATRKKAEAFLKRHAAE